MAKYIVHRLAFGASVAPELTYDWHDFYPWLVERVFPDMSRWQDASNAITIPIKNEQLLDREIIRQVLEDMLRSWPHDVEVMLIDMFHPYRGSIPNHIYMEIAAILADYSKEALANRYIQKRILLLVPELLPESHIFWAVAAELTDDSHFLTVIDRLGHSRPDKGFGTEALTNEFSEVRRKSQNELLDKFIQRLVRRHGHYQHDRQKCRRFYFDGYLGKHELRDLLFDHIRIHYAKNMPAFLLYEEDAPDWLIETISALPLEIDPYKVGDDIPNDLVTGEVTPPLLICEMIDTGKALQNTLEKLHVKYPQIMPSITAILTTKQLNEKRMAIVLQQKASIEFHALHEVKPFSEASGEHCEMCRLQIPVSVNPRLDDYLDLTSYDFWCMVREVGLQPNEDNCPKHTGRFERPPLRYVPRFPKLISHNGAWLAAKIEQRVLNELGSWPLNLTFVCPSDEKGSAAFAEVLHHTLRVDVVKLPRSAIEKYTQVPKGKSPPRIEDEYAEESWFKQLVACANTVIIFDDFTVSRGTLDGISVILGQLNKYILFFFTLCDFRQPDHREEPDVSPILVHSLYSWPRNAITQQYLPKGVRDNVSKYSRKRKR